MPLSENIFTALSSDAGVLTALGAAAAPGAIYPNRAPDSATLPFIVVQLVAGVIDATQKDTGQFSDSLFQFSCYGATYKAARDLRKAVLNAFIALDVTGLAGAEKFTAETQRDLFETVTDAHHCILEMRFFHDPTA